MVWTDNMPHSGLGSGPRNPCSN